MPATSRVLMSPVSINAAALSGAASSFGAVAPSAGIDAAAAGGTTFGTAWPGILAGVNYVGNGSQFLWGYNGANACTAYVLIGQKAGGQVQPYTTYAITLPTSGYFIIPPLSPLQYTQQDASQFVTGVGNGGIAPGGQILTSGVGTICVDFSATTTSTVALRLYQLTTVTP
jgi:hypothetical protein